MKRIKVLIIGLCATLLFTSNVAFAENFIEVDPEGYGWAETIPAKYEDTVLFGSDILGHEDGAAELASTAIIWSMTTDKHNNIYFIDSEQPYWGTGGYRNGSRDNEYYYVHENNNYPHNPIPNNQRIRRYDSTTKSISTIAVVNDMSLNYQASESSTVIYQNSSTISKKQQLTEFVAYKLCYDEKNDRIYLAGKYKRNFGKPAYRGVWYTIDCKTDTMKASICDSSANFIPGSDDFAIVVDNNIIYSRRDGANSFEVYRTREKGKAVKFTTATGTCNIVDNLEAVMTQNYLTVMKRNDSSIIMSRYDLRKREWAMIADYKANYDSIVASNGKFYVTAERDIDVVDVDGTMKPFIKSQETNLTGAVDGGKIFHMNVTAEGSINYYDSVNGIVRKISPIK